MTVMAVFFLDETQRQAAIALNDQDAAVDPQAITNPLANNVGAGLGIGNLVGLYMLPARILTDPAYSRWHALLANVPVYTIDPASLFTPVP